MSNMSSKEVLIGDQLWYRGNLSWLPSNTIYLTKHGSHAYGLNTPTSDLDYKGIAIPPKSYFLGNDRFEQAELKDHERNVEGVIYELRKFCNLAAKGNPSVLEVLWTDPSDHVVITPLGEKLIANKELFLSKEIRQTFSGYARSQLKRIKLHYHWHKKGDELHQPTREEYQLPEHPELPTDQLKAALAIIDKKLDQWNLKDIEFLEPAARIAVVNTFSNILSEMEIGADRWHRAAGFLGYKTNFLMYLNKEKLFRAAQSEWDSYLTWKKERNEARAAIEEKYGYDCYADDTEFLTSNGWKKFDDICENDLLGTVFINRGKQNVDLTNRKLYSVEYQRPTNKFDANYTGPMYLIYGQHTDVFVTANHRMLFRKIERRSGKEYEWELEEASFLPDTFDVLAAPKPKTTTYCNKMFENLPIPERAYLSLMGWYLSDGCASFKKHSDGVKSIRISQKLYGKLSWNIARWHSSYKDIVNSSLNDYERQPNEYNKRKHIERVLDVRHPYVVTKIVDECGYKTNKRIPRYVFGLSKLLMEVLLMGLIRGDGTRREHKTKEGSYIYYSKSKLLADDVQELAVMAGWETALWGPYESDDCCGRKIQIYQVHLRKGRRTRRLIRSANVRKIEVVGQRIVCFTVPNGTLITRRNGKVSIHGNCKHAMHLVRLQTSCEEALTTGKLLVKRPDREALLAIRNGAWSYDQLIEYAETKDKQMDEVWKNSKLPSQADYNKINNLCIELAEASLNGAK